MLEQHRECRVMEDPPESASPLEAAIAHLRVIIFPAAGRDVLTAATPRQLVWQLIQGRFIRIRGYGISRSVAELSDSTQIDE